MAYFGRELLFFKMDFGFPAKIGLPHLFSSDLMLLVYKEIFINVIKMCFKHAPSCC